MIFLAGLAIAAPGYCFGQSGAENPVNNRTAPLNDPVIARSDIVYDKGPALCPNLTMAADGDLIVSWVTQGDGIPGQTTYLARSSDQGRTWSAPYLVLKSDKPRCGLSFSLQRLPDSHDHKGRLLGGEFELEWPATGDPDPTNMKQYLSLAAGRKFDYYYCFSDDNGYAFSPKQRLNDPIKRNDFPQGNIVQLPSGDLLWPWGYWGSEPLNGFRRSTDGGLTWQPVKRSWQDPPPGHDKPLAFNETAVTLARDGSIIAIARVDSLVAKKFWMIRSRDNGHTWTTPRQIEIAGGSPALYSTDHGQLWLAYRDGGLGPGLGLAVSDDNGETWRFLYHLKEPKGEHEKLYGHICYSDEDRKKAWRPGEGVVGYPCFWRLSPREVYVVFHAHNRSELPKRFPKGADPFYVVGNLLKIPE